MKFAQGGHVEGSDDKVPCLLDDGYVVTTHSARSFMAPRFWRNPIRWWKARHIRRELRRPQSPAERHINEQMERAFLFGDSK